MDKKKFCQILKKLENARRFEEAIWGLCNNYSHDNHTDISVFGLGMGLDVDVVDLLQEIMQDKAEDIGYFCYELDFGKEYKPGCITEDGNEIDFSTAEKLYDYLTRDDK